MGTTRNDYSYSPDASKPSSMETMPGIGTVYSSNAAQPSAQNTIYNNRQLGSRQPSVTQSVPPDAASTNLGSQMTTLNGATGSAIVYRQSNAMNYGNSSTSTVTTRPQATASADVSMADHHGYARGTLEEKWVSYQRTLGGIFQAIDNGSLESASEALLSGTSWLLSQVADLGLNLDDTNLHGDRIQLWNDFNHAWLGLGQRQIDLMNSSQELSKSQSLVSKAMIKRLGNELIRLCDGIEHHGLVDYQYGVWEDQITAVLEDCLDRYEASVEASDSGNR